MTLDQLIEIMPSAAEDLKTFQVKILELFPNTENFPYLENDLLLAFCMGHTSGGRSAIKDLRAKDKESDKQRLANDRGMY